MKKMLIAVTTIVFLCTIVFLGCEKSETNGVQRTAMNGRTNSVSVAAMTPSGPGWPPYPPLPGYHWVLEYQFGGFNFHRPKNGCVSGFWFCVLAHQWVWKLKPNIGAQEQAYIADDTAYLWGEPLNDSQVVLHFPKELETLPSYTTEDLDSLNVDDTMFISNNAILRLGNYPVDHTDSDLTVNVNVEVIK